jgi:hypothetical protein
LAKQIEAAGLPVIYEETTLNYVWPQRQSRYTPDFQVGDIFIEAKGIFDVTSRQKMLLVAEQNPEADIRLVFSNSNQKLYAGSKTSYADWARKHGFEFGHKTIPEEWLALQGEPENDSD